MPANFVRFVMFSVQRVVKISYVLALGSVVLVLSRPAPVRAQRTLAYPFLPGQAALIAARAQLLTTAATPMVSYSQAQSMLTQAGAPVDPFGVGMSGGVINGVLGGNGQGAGGGMQGIQGMGGGMGGMGGFSGKGMGGFNGKKPL
jgi:hypothetical protein